MLQDAHKKSASYSRELLASNSSDIRWDPRGRLWAIFAWAVERPFRYELRYSESLLDLIYMLTMYRHPLFLECISATELAKTFLDTIQVTWQLDIEYLWIDSLHYSRFSGRLATRIFIYGVYLQVLLMQITSTGFLDSRSGLFAEKGPAMLEHFCWNSSLRGRYREQSGRGSKSDEPNARWVKRAITIIWSFSVRSTYIFSPAYLSANFPSRNFRANLHLL